MKIFAPEYYKSFKCIADKCKNSCCIGWEIDIDDDTLEAYKKVEGVFGERLKKSISKGTESCFILEKGERCPFLNEKNLCDIYIELGEESLCNICKDHPRFRNFFGSRTEMGLGMCCEAATDLIMDWEKPFSLSVIEENDEPEVTDDEESVFFALRDKAIRVIEKEESLIDTFGVNIPEKSFGEWVDVFLSLEILDPEWTEILNSAKKCKEPKKGFLESDKGKNAQKQLLLYFIYRHTAEGIYDGTFLARIGFAVLSLEMIKALCGASENSSLETFKDLARRYSAEIEYCQENTERLIDIICNKKI